MFEYIHNKILENKKKKEKQQLKMQNEWHMENF